MNKEQKEKHDALLEALDVEENGFFEDHARFKEKHGRKAQDVLDEALKAYADIYPSLCAFDAVGSDAMQGEWVITDENNDYKFSVIRRGGIVPSAVQDLQCGNACDASFITIAANMRAKIKGGLV